MSSENEAASYNFTTVEAAFARTKEIPLREILIGDRAFAVGDLSEEQWAALKQSGLQCAQGIPSAVTRDPIYILRQLLIAGDPETDFVEVQKHVRREHVLIANKEMTRQAIVRALSANTMAGKA